MSVTNYYVKVELDPCDVTDGNKLVIYDSSSAEFKLVNKNDREGNICYTDRNGPAGFQDLTITLDSTVFPEGVSGSFGYVKIDCDAVDTTGYSVHQSTRTVLIWDSSSGNNLAASTIEEARFPTNKVIHDIKQTTASFDATGSLVFQVYQYNINDITYCLKYSLL